MYSKNLHSLCKKIVAVGRNYRDHAVELGNKVPEKPVIFMKPSSAIIEEGEDICIPADASELHHEVELGVVIGQTIKHADPSKAMEAVAGYVLALDMTNRQLQNDLKTKGLPWTLAKCFDTSCPIGPFIDRSLVSDPHQLTLWLEVNGSVRQRGSTTDMLFPIGQLLAFVSESMRLEPGDILLTGTPAGVGPVRAGDTIRAGIEGLSTVQFRVVHTK